MLKIFLTCACFFDSQKRTIEKLKDKFDRESEKFNKERMDRENEVSHRPVLVSISLYVFVLFARAVFKSQPMSESLRISRSDNCKRHIYPQDIAH